MRIYRKVVKPHFMGKEKGMCGRIYLHRRLIGKKVFITVEEPELEVSE